MAFKKIKNHGNELFANGVLIKLPEIFVEQSDYYYFYAKDYNRL